MSEFRVATRYAKALLDLAREQNAIQTVQQDILNIVEVMESHPQLRAVLNNPIVKLDKKQTIIEQVFGEKMHPSVAGFFRIMAQKGRAGLLLPIAREFINLYNQEMNIVNAKVVSAIALSAMHQEQLAALLKEATGSDIILQNEVDPNLIGGFVVRVGDRQVDASVLGKLQRLEKHFKEELI